MQINREKNVETFILCRKKNPAFVHNYRKSDRTRQKCAEDWISEKNCKTPLTNPEKSVILVKQSTFTDNGGLDMAKDLRIILLLDCYGAFLTPRQQEMMTHYYSEDLSLGEIAALTGTTRQAAVCRKTLCTAAKLCGNCPGSGNTGSQSCRTCGTACLCCDLQLCGSGLRAALNEKRQQGGFHHGV